MFELVLVLEATCCAAGCGERGDEDVRCWGEGFELLGPFGAVFVHEGGEFCLGCFGRDGRCATGDCVDAADFGVRKEAGEDVGSLFGRN